MRLKTSRTTSKNGLKVCNNEPIERTTRVYEHARVRMVQKKRLYIHFVLFLVGSLVMFILNKAFNIGQEFLLNWYAWAILLWSLFLILHVINVFFFSKFMGIDWERRQIEKLIAKQEKKFIKMEKEMAYEEKLKNERVEGSEETKKKIDKPNG